MNQQFNIARHIIEATGLTVDQVAEKTGIKKYTHFPSFTSPPAKYFFHPAKKYFSFQMLKFVKYLEYTLIVRMFVG